MTVLVVGEQDVGGLEVAVDDAEGVGAVEGAGALAEDANDVDGRDPAAVDAVGERLADEELHHQEGLAFVGDAEVVDLDGVAGAQLRGNLCLGEEPRAGVLAQGCGRREQLHREVRLERDVASAPDLTHAAFTQQRLEGVAPPDDPRQLGHWSGSLHR